MNTTLSSVRSLDRERNVTITIPGPEQRIAPADRLALRLGLWLLLRRERSVRRPSDDARHVTMHSNADARAERERRAERDWYVRAIL